jgi:molecular chaperone GrpE
MEPKNNLKEPEIFVEIADAETLASVEDFIKELEAKEKDLHITADYQIEIEDSDLDDPAIPEFVQQDLPKPAAKAKTPAAEPTGGQSSGLKTRVFELQQEVERLEGRLRELRTERNEIQEKSDRRLKDFENYKYRIDRERRGAFIDQISNLASQMLPVLDNLDRALDAALAVPEEKHSEFKQFFDGMMLVHQQINEVFGGMGVEAIKTVGETFDPNFHEAVSVEERGDVPANTILEEMLRGYRIGNRVIRHSMVKVTASSESVKKPSKQDVSSAKKPAEEKAIEEPPPAAIPAPTDLLPENEISLETE